MQKERDANEADADGHRWHCHRYVKDFVARLGPGFQGPLIRSFLTFPELQPFRFVELGVGDGRVAEMLLREFPRASGVGVDFSEPMLELASRRLTGDSGRFEFVVADLNERNWSDKLRGPWQLVVTRKCLHHLNDDRLFKVYDEIYQLLEPGGLFLNLDRVRVPAGGMGFLVYWVAARLPVRLSCREAAIALIERTWKLESCQRGYRVALTQHLKQLRCVGFHPVFRASHRKVFLMCARRP